MKRSVFLVLSLALCCLLAVNPARAAEAETAPQGLEGEILLRVSSLDLTLVGDQEDVYAGSLPREAVTWQSGNPEIVTFENGVLTATGVGSTTVSASYEGKKAEIPVSCLAEDRETLLKLSPEILQKPKRQPPVVTPDNRQAFGNAALIGDSQSYVLFQYQMTGNDLGDMVYMTRAGVTVRSLEEHYKELRYMGQDGHIEDLIRESGVKKAFFMLGQGDLEAMTPQKTLDTLDTLLDRILEKSPDLKIYLQSPFPEYGEGTETLERNETLRQYRELLKAFCEEKGYQYVEVGAYGENHLGNLAEAYHADQIHLNTTGCTAWIRALKAHMQAEALQKP